MTDAEQMAWDLLEDEAMRQLSMDATNSRFPLIVIAGCEMRRLRVTLADRDAQLCRVREALDEFHILMGDRMRVIHIRAALSSTAPCVHGTELRLWKAVEMLCREALGSIINATTTVQGRVYCTRR